MPSKSSVLVFHADPDPKIGFGTDINKKIASGNGLCGPTINDPGTHGLKTESGTIEPSNILTQEQIKERIIEFLKKNYKNLSGEEMLYLVQAYGLNDKVIAQKIGYPGPAFTTIRNKVLEAYWKKHGIPDEPGHHAPAPEGAGQPPLQIIYKPTTKSSRAAATASPSDGNGNGKKKIKMPTGRPPHPSAAQRAKLLEEIHRARQEAEAATETEAELQPEPGAAEAPGAVAEAEQARQAAEAAAAEQAEQERQKAAKAAEEAARVKGKGKGKGKIPPPPPGQQPTTGRAEILQQLQDPKNITKLRTPQPVKNRRPVQNQDPVQDQDPVNNNAIHQAQLIKAIKARANAEEEPEKPEVEPDEWEDKSGGGYRRRKSRGKPRKTVSRKPRKTVSRKPRKTISRKPRKTVKRKSNRRVKTRRKRR